MPTDADIAAQALAPLASDLYAAGVARVCLFGSRSRGDGHAGSDWDLMVEFFRPVNAVRYFGLKAQLQRALGGSVSICSPQYSSATFCSAVARDCQEIFRHG